MVLAEIADGAVVGPEVAGKPDGGEVFAAGVLKPAAGAGASEVAPEVEFEEGGGVVRAAAFGESATGSEAEGGEIERVDEGADGTGGRNVVVDGGRKQHGLVAVGCCDIPCHGAIMGFLTENSKGFSDSL